MNTLVNRRKSKRFHIPLNMEFVSLKKSVNEYCFAKTRDFSSNGLSFTSNANDIELGELIMIKFELLQDNTYVYALGNIKWKRQVADKFLVGVKIRRIDQESRGKQLNFPFNIWADDTQDNNFQATEL